MYSPPPAKRRNLCQGEIDVYANLYEMQMNEFNVFKEQNPEDFDVVFKIDGKKLYADKSRIGRISETFKSWLSDRWTSKDKEILVKDYPFDHFEEFLSFIYSGKCSLDEKNICNMVDMAEIYSVKTLKRACEKYLSDMCYDNDNVFICFQLYERYSFAKLKEPANDYICERMPFIDMESETFKKLPKSVVKELFEFNKRTLRMEEFFEAVFTWAEYQAQQKLDANININATIKNEMSELLEFFKFEQMSIEYLEKFVGNKAKFLFSDEKLDEFLSSAKDKIYVRISNIHKGKIMKGIMRCDNMKEICKVIESRKHKSSLIFDYFRTQSSSIYITLKVINIDEVKWFLCYSWDDGDFSLKPIRDISKSDNIVAEVIPEVGFSNVACRIEIYHYN